MMATMLKEAVAGQPDDLSSRAEWTRATKRELVGRVVQSATFARCERLSSLLTYVCETTLNGKGSELNEQRIGHAVFARKPDYDSSVDGIVRTQASRLRQRLEVYFNGEGAGEAIRIDIPRGGYVPIFTENRSTAVVEPKPPAESLAPATFLPVLPLPEVEPIHSLQYLPWLLCCLFALVAAASWILRPRTVPLKALPAHPLWDRVFTPNHTTLEVPGDTGLVLSYAFTQRGVNLSEYLGGGYSTPSRATRSQGEGSSSIEKDISSRRYTSIVDLAVAVNLQRLALQHGGSLQVRYARDLRPNDLKSGNSILVGALEGNPWLEMFEPRMKFRMVNDYQRHVFSVINQEPKPGEPERWESSKNDPHKRVYGVIALEPNLSGDGSVFVVEGTSMAGVEAAWDFVSDDETLLPLLHRMQRPDGSLPWFEVLIGTQNMAASASHTELVAWDVH